MPKYSIHRGTAKVEQISRRMWTRLCFRLCLHVCIFRGQTGALLLDQGRQKLLHAIVLLHYATILFQYGIISFHKLHLWAEEQMVQHSVDYRRCGKQDSFKCQYCCTLQSNIITISVCIFCKSLKSTAWSCTCSTKGDWIGGGWTGIEWSIIIYIKKKEGKGKCVQVQSCSSISTIYICSAYHVLMKLNTAKVSYQTTSA